MVNVPHHIAIILAKFMEKRANEAEIAELTQWINAYPENMSFFESILQERNTNWSKEWFKKAGVRNNYFKGKSFNGWYKPEITNPRYYYILTGLSILLLIILFIVELLT
ncbi:MAG: hypothetical protein J7497_16150 [Chitinophagaceae bacterium]|nr:hypothetical protein [Chitinophagaceae bacterium]